MVTKIANGNEETAPLEEVKVGDRLLIRNQEIIPADAYLLKGESQMDYSFVTGESELIPIQAGQSIYAGGKHQGEAIEIQISKELNQSHLTQLWEQQAFKDPNHKTENWENFFECCDLRRKILRTILEATWIGQGVTHSS